MNLQPIVTPTICPVCGSACDPERVVLSDLTRQIFHGGRDIELSPNQFALAKLLAAHMGVDTVDSRALMAELHGSYGSVTASLSQLRYRLSSVGLTVRSIYGVGYAMERHPC